MGAFLTSSEIGRILGVSVATVRRWADAGLLPAQRTAGGHRRFSLEVAERLARPREGGIEPGIAAWVEVLTGPGGPLAVDAALLVERSRQPSWAAVAVVLGRVLTALGERWADGHLAVTQEHVASARLYRALARVSDAHPVRPGAPRALLAVTEGEAHTLGLALVELCLRERGWPTTWIGRDLDVALLARRAEQGGAEVLVVSASVVREPDALAAQAEQLAQACARGGLSLLVGGSGRWPEPLAGGEVIRDLFALRAWTDARDGHRAR